ncbi:hypothetical protein F4825DRAFT_459252 [Nemania diffusa]|nr:hypothetical protein F4825DRAFT_459252 [Nemania diffusa]
MVLTTYPRIRIPTLNYLSGSQCGCKRSFNSESALAQHRADKQKANIGAACRTISVPKSTSSKTATTAKSKEDRWMWNGARTHEAFHVLSTTALHPCTAVVSSKTASELICSYSWQNSEQPCIKIPGFAPIWQPIPLPATLPADKGTYFIDQNASRVPKYPFEPVFRAAEVMNPTVDFADVDIVINRNSLRKLLDFCAGLVKRSFRVNLSMIGNTLFIERCERNTHTFIGDAQVPSWGHNFEKSFTKLPKELEDSSQYHRIIRYPLGELNCVVRCEVDACYQGEQVASDGTHISLAIDSGKLSTGSNPTRKKVARRQNTSDEREFRLMPQSTVAEVKTISPNQSPRCLPQLWFGRTPWLIMGRHTGGTFDSIDTIKAKAKFKAWEMKNQKKLRKLVSLLSQLRESVQNSGFKRCIAIYEKSKTPQELKIFASVCKYGALPDDLAAKFWHGKSNESAIKA